MLAGPLLLLLHAIGPTFKTGEQHDHLGSRLIPCAFFVMLCPPTRFPCSLDGSQRKRESPPTTTTVPYTLQVGNGCAWPDSSNVTNLQGTHCRRGVDQAGWSTWSSMHLLTLVNPNPWTAYF